MGQRPCWYALVLLGRGSPLCRQHLEACRFWRRGKKKRKIVAMDVSSVMVCARAFGIDQWGASSWRYDTYGFDVGIKNNQNPHPSLVVETCLSASKNPHKSKSVITVVFRHALKLVGHWYWSGGTGVTDSRKLLTLTIWT